MKKFIAAVFILPFALPALAETKNFDLAGIAKVEVNNANGKITVGSTAQGQATVVADKKRFGKHCQLTIDMRGETLFVEVRDSGGRGNECEVDLTITGPKTAALDLDSGSGELKVKGTSGDLTFNVGSGSVSIDADIKKLDGNCGSGDITIKGLTAGGKVKTGSGDISLAYRSAPAAGDLDIVTGSGNADVLVPKATKLKSSFTAGSGALTNEVGDSRDGKFLVSMKTGSGNLHIRKQ